MADIPNEGYYRRLLNAIMSGEEVPDWSGRPTAAERDLYSDWLSPAERLRRQADKMRAWERGSLRSFEPPAPDYLGVDPDAVMRDYFFGPAVPRRT